MEPCGLSTSMVDILQGKGGPLSCVTQSKQHVFRLPPGWTGAFLLEILLECLYEAKFYPFQLSAPESIYIFMTI